MEFKYIKDNLKKIIDNKDKILFIESFFVPAERTSLALFAIIKEDDGIYKKIQSTKRGNDYTL